MRFLCISYAFCMQFICILNALFKVHSKCIKPMQFECTLESAFKMHINCI